MKTAFDTFRTIMALAPTLARLLPWEAANDGEQVNVHHDYLLSP
jgi:hypothetical protein